MAGRIIGKMLSESINGKFFRTVLSMYNVKLCISIHGTQSPVFHANEGFDKGKIFPFTSCSLSMTCKE